MFTIVVGRPEELPEAVITRAKKEKADIAIRTKGHTVVWYALTPEAKAGIDELEFDPCHSPFFEHCYITFETIEEWKEKFAGSTEFRIIE